MAEVDEGGMDMDRGSGWAECGFALYGAPMRRIYRAALRLTGTVLSIAMLAGPTAASAAPKTILAFGDSIFAGYGVAQQDSFPAQLEAALKADGRDVRVINAAVSGDTTADGVARLDWSLAEKPDLVLLELGANDALRGLDPDNARANLDHILAKLKAANLPVLICGMIAPRNLGPAYSAKFDPMYGDLAKKYQAPIYPFILDGVALDASLSQADGMHPNPKGVAVIVKRMLPFVEKALP
jgi:acyl-CoA thioesterase-1